MSKESYQAHFENASFILKSLFAFVGGGIALYSAFIAQTITALVEKNLLRIDTTDYLRMLSNVAFNWGCSVSLLMLTFTLTYFSNRYYLVISEKLSRKDLDLMPLSRWEKCWVFFQNILVLLSIISGLFSAAFFLIGFWNLKDFIALLKPAG